MLLNKLIQKGNRIYRRNVSEIDLPNIWTSKNRSPNLVHLIQLPER